MSLKEYYQKTVVPELMKQRGYKNVMQAPRLQKIVLNMGVGEAVANRKVLDEAVELLTNITGQKAVVTKSKTAISNFKLREGLGIGARVTLHGENMWDFLYRFINIDLPRVRDFRGIPRRGFDGSGNYTMGIKEQTIFVEVDIDKISQTLGMDITFVTSAKTDEDGRALLEALGLPFRK
ncbi:MAG TPA: 50S ribosomal protein L5 [Fibrobacteraceae bacterium]|nr:50S ribosomal protein L5 [Fibrobacteraceae bacterium]